ncbi:MAG TPA: hypothetical protein DCL54_03440 [Alphaproteobacteria bacterium]|nr:hypothetical protein [Alphaproteobacteria bacterium]HAJ45618.1 hypothetical protein [Alphaproteobacteria bacterium]
MSGLLSGSMSGSKCPGVRIELTPSNGLREIARQRRRLAPDHRKPEAFHETKSDLVAALIAIAAALEDLRQ